MVDQEEEFRNIFGGEEKRPVVSKVLKKVKVSPGKRAISYDTEQVGEERIEPIVEAGKVVGVRYFCKCGNVAEIYFEFQE